MAPGLATDLLSYPAAQEHPAQTQVISSLSQLFADFLLQVEGASEELEDRFKLAP
jgi:hypothetical protein